MGYLIHFVLALAALAASETGLGHLVVWPVAVALLALVPHALLRGTRRAALRGSFKTAERLERLLIWSPPLLYFIALAVFGWSASVQRWTGIETALLVWPHPVELAALAPFALYGLVSIDARARMSDSRDAEIARTRRFHQRMFATGAVPLTVFVLGAWALGANEVVRVQLEEVALFGAALTALTAGAFVLVLPAALVRLWDTQPLPAGDRRRVLEELAERAGFRCREVLVWLTGNRMSNAAVVGLGSRTRVVMFTDALLTQLSIRELRAVFAHEIGHVHYRHALSFLAWALAFFLGLDLLSEHVPVSSDLVALALLGAAFLAWFAAFGWLSRRVELEADLYSLELTGDLPAMLAALERVGGAHPRQLSGWRHFSTAKRVEHLTRAAVDPGVARRLHARLRFAGRLGLVLMVVAIGLEGWKLGESYPLDRLRADVRLGEFSAASRRLEDLRDDEPEHEIFARTLQRAVRFGDGARGAALEEAARTAIDRGDLEAAFDYSSLATWRGARELDPVVSVLAAHLDGEALDRGVLEQVPAEWREPLRRALRTGSR